jgi:2-phosphoglycolate phosphatase
MATPLRAVLFDLDGTLLDTAPDFSYVLNGMLRSRRREEITYERVRQNVSHGARALVQLGFGLEPEAPGFAALHRELLDLYEANLSRKTRLFPGIGALLDFIEARGMAWGVVTNKPRLYTGKVLDAMALRERCAVMVCPEDVSNRKPHPEPILLACEQLACQPGEAIYVGDHRRDIAAGLDAGALTIAAAYGYVDPQDPPETWGAHHLAARAEDLLSLIEQAMEPPA